MKTRLLVVDTETGGLRPDRHALLSIAAIDSMTGEQFSSYIQPSPEWLIDSFATAINGITPEILAARGRPEPEVLADFIAWIKPRQGGIFAGCNPTFDSAFLLAACKRCGLSWHPRRLMSLESAAWLAYERRLLDLPLWQNGSPKLNLDAVAAALGLYRTGTVHDALEDATLTLNCFKKLTTL